MTIHTETLPMSVPDQAGRPRIFFNALHACARILFGKLLPKLPYPILRGPLRGRWYILGATAGEAGGVSVHLGMQEVEQSKCLSRILRPGQIFFDVGANVGFYSLLGSKIVGPDGTVIAFEPMPRNLAFLFRHLRLNNAANATILPLACAEDISTELFFEGKNNALGRLGEENNETDSIRGRNAVIVVATTSLDVAAEKLHVRPDLIKIDVEGAELRVLKGAKSILTRERPSLLLSVHSAQLRDDCLSYLAELKYGAEPLNADSIAEATEFLAQPLT